MAKYRQVHTKIWKDDWFSELEPLNKFFFIYLFTNELSSLCGMYQLSKRVMSFESGLTAAEIDGAFEIFGEDNKAFYDGKVVFIPSLRKYHETKSSTVQTSIKKDIDDIPEGDIKELYRTFFEGIDRVSDRVSDTVQYIYNSSSSSSSLKGTQKKQEYFPPEVQKILDALTEITKTAFDADVFSDATYQLVGHDATPEEVKGFAGWWKRNGYYKGKPAVKSILTEWNNYKTGETVADQSGVNIYPEVKGFMTGAKRFQDLTPPAQSFVKANGANDLKKIRVNSFEETQIKKQAENYVQ